MSAERRQSPRYTVSVPSSVTTGDGQSYLCEILDLSETGCRIRLKEPVGLWGVITLRTEAEETMSRVIWSRGAEAGLWFPPEAEEEQPEPGFLKRLFKQLSRA